MEIEDFLQRESLQLASLGKRAVALLIDMLIVSVLLFVVFADSFTVQTSPDAFVELQQDIMMFYLPLAFFYQAIFVTLYGATLGKMAMKIRIIELQTGDNPQLLVSINRSVVRIISELVLNLGFLWGALDPNRQTWHDKTAKTIVIDA